MTKTICTATVFCTIIVVVFLGWFIPVADYVWRDRDSSGQSQFSLAACILANVIAPILVLIIVVSFVIGLWLVSSDICGWLRREVD